MCHTHFWSETNENWNSAIAEMARVVFVKAFTAQLQLASQMQTLVLRRHVSMKE